MPNHRMFSNRIANSGKFLQMPTESQLLYFHMVLRADDDGVVESYPVMKLLGLAPDSFKVLLARNFIKQLNEDQVIVITNWREHNKIRADRKTDSIYKDLLKEAEIPTLQAKPRSDVKDNSKRTDNGRTKDSIRQVKLSKVKLRQDKISKEKEEEKLTPLEEMKLFLEGKEFFTKLAGHISSTTNIPPAEVSKELENFKGYWTEKNKTGTKQRWEMEKTFELKRRLTNWFKKVNQFKGQDSPKVIKI